VSLGGVGSGRFLISMLLTCAVYTVEGVGDGFGVVKLKLILFVSSMLV
jgi:hypothetical protein